MKKILCLIALSLCCLKSFGGYVPFNGSFAVYCLCVVNGSSIDFAVEYQDAVGATVDVHVPAGRTMQFIAGAGTGIFFDSWQDAQTNNSVQSGVSEGVYPYLNSDGSTNPLVLVLFDAGGFQPAQGTGWTANQFAGAMAYVGLPDYSLAPTAPLSGSQQVADVVEGFEFGVGPAFVLFAIYMIRRGLQPAIQD